MLFFSCAMDLQDSISHVDLVFSLVGFINCHDL